jgi:hypothetical protein
LPDKSAVVVSVSSAPASVTVAPLPSDAGVIAPNTV